MTQTIDTEVTRVDAPRKISGTATYAGDVTPAGMLHAALATSAIATGTLTAIDVTKAEAEPGVIAVYTHETIPDFRSVKAFGAGGPGTASFWPMEGTEIRYAGQPVSGSSRRVPQPPVAARSWWRLLMRRPSRRSTWTRPTASW